jgi:hypothetical protein
MTMMTMMRRMKLLLHASVQSVSDLLAKPQLASVQFAVRQTMIDAKHGEE